MKLKNRSMVTKIAVLYAVITIFNVTVFNIIIWENQTELIIKSSSHESQYIGAGLKSLVDNILHYSGDLDSKTIQQIEEEAKQIGIKINRIFDEKGKILNNVDPGTEISQYERIMINSAITKQSFENRIFVHKLNQKERTIDLFIPFTFNTDQKGVLYTVLQLNDIDKQMKYLYGQCLLISVIIILVHIAFALIVVMIFIIPLRKFFPVIKDISKGNFHSRVPLHGTDELGQLASSFNLMCLEVTRMQDEAKGANPLTSLPGNNVISQTIDDYLKSRTPFTVLYCDLDNFKAYNDKYGFTKGDDVILYTRDQLLAAAKSPYVHDIFIGHEGGDDFVVISPFDCWEAYAKEFIRIFDNGIRQFYNSADAKHGYIQSINRSGEPERFPIIGISIAAVSNTVRYFSHFGEMVQAAASVKKYVKSIDGSSYKLDTRNMNPSTEHQEK